MYEGTTVNQSWFNTELYMERKVSVQPVTNTCSLVYDIDKNDFSVYDSSNNLEAMVKQEKTPNCLRILRSSHTIVVESSVYLENKFRKIILKRNHSVFRYQKSFTDTFGRHGIIKAFLLYKRIEKHRGNAEKPLFSRVSRVKIFLASGI